MSAPIAAVVPEVVGLRLTGAMLSDVGCVRPHNEDAVAFVVPAQDATTAQQDSLLLVADGMGGHAAGEVASTLAAEVIRRVYFERGGVAAEALAAAFEAANKAIHGYAERHPECAGMGTTCTALAIRGSQGVARPRGRYPRLPDARRDAHPAQRRPDAGGEAGARGRAHRGRGEPQRAQQRHSAGARDDVSRSSPKSGPKAMAIGPGDILVLSSDGLHGLVDDGDDRRRGGAAVAHGGLPRADPGVPWRPAGTTTRRSGCSARKKPAERKTRRSARRGGCACRNSCWPKAPTMSRRRRRAR